MFRGSSLRRALQVAALSALAIVMAPRAGAGQTAQAAPNTCLTCHATLNDARLSKPAALFTAPDVHRESGFACVDCHGGDPSAADKTRSHDAGHGFKGKPAGQAVIATCARCHSDAEAMRRYAPRQRVDQATEYATSVHGKLLATGDTKVATCVSCHGAHGIRLVKDAKSPVFPTNVAGTCAACHANTIHMAGYKLADGSPIPTTQLADYQKSVHFAALTKGNDLSAPTCNDCHGNHGAAPPGVGAVANVCGTCHAVFAQKFQTSVHAQIFDKGCVECHSNHAVLQPSDDMLGTKGHAICATCHSSAADDKGGAGADAMRGSIDRLKHGIDNSDALIARVRNAGMEVSAEELALGDARSQLTLARTEMHASNPAKVDAVAQDGLKILAGVDQGGQKAVAELRFRRTGLAVSLAAILLVVVAIVLKVRQIDRRRT
jgi:predicted CXXCH cytochrome family protein